MIIKGYVFTYLYLAFILFISTVVNKKFKVKKILTRKFVHISISFCYVIMYYYFGNTIHINIPPISFIILNILSKKINLFEGMEDEENSNGTIYYPISVFIMALITYFNNDFYASYGIGLFCMAFGDGFAPLVAGYLKSRKIYNHKTISGTLTVFIFSIMVAIIFNEIFVMNLNVFKIFIIGVASSLLELLGKRGLDNLYLPLGVSLLTYFLEVI